MSTGVSDHSDGNISGPFQVTSYGDPISIISRTLAITIGIIITADGFRRFLQSQRGSAWLIVIGIFLLISLRDSFKLRQLLVSAELIELRFGREIKWSLSWDEIISVGSRTGGFQKRAKIIIEMAAHNPKSLHLNHFTQTQLRQIFVRTAKFARLQITKVSDSANWLD